MRGGALPPALLCAVLGLLLAYAPRRAIAPALVALAVIAGLVVLVGVPARLEEIAFLGCWLSVLATAGALHFKGGPGRWTAFGLGANAGLWVGAVVAIAGEPLDLAIALPVSLLVFPAIWVLTTPARLAVKIVASWLAAVAILAAAVPLTPTPGYEPDHMS